MITCVTAPSRSGTSLTMQMLQAADVPLWWDALPNRTAWNPRGHFEINTRKNNDWTILLPLCEGRAIKVMPFDLYRLTPDHEYRFITILRNPTAVDASQQAAVEFRGAKMSDADKTKEWQRYTLDFIKDYPHVIVNFDDLFNGKAQQSIGEFMGFDDLQIAKMNDCVDPELRHF
jgi:hypothetical protein